MSLADLTVRRLLERTADRVPMPGGGVMAALTAASAAGLVAMAARFSSREGPFAEVADRADALRRRAIELADADAQAFAAVLEETQRPALDPDRERRLAEAWGAAADVPAETAEVARELGGLGVRLLREGNPNLRGDAATGVLLADAAARSAAVLVALNVRAGGLDDARLVTVRRVCAELAESVAAAERSA